MASNRPNPYAALKARFSNYVNALHARHTVESFRIQAALGAPGLDMATFANRVEAASQLDYDTLVHVTPAREVVFTFRKRVAIPVV